MYHLEWDRAFSFLISLLDNQLNASAVTNTSPTKAPRPISWEDYCHQAETPWSMYYFPFIKHAYLDKDSGLMGRLTEVWLTLSGFYPLRGLICTERGGHREAVFIYGLFMLYFEGSASQQCDLAPTLPAVTLHRSRPQSDVKTQPRGNKPKWGIFNCKIHWLCLGTCQHRRDVVTPYDALHGAEKPGWLRLFRWCYTGCLFSPFPPPMQRQRTAMKDWR